MGRSTTKTLSWSAGTLVIGLVLAWAPVTAGQEGTAEPPPTPPEAATGEAPPASPPDPDPPVADEAPPVETPDPTDPPAEETSPDPPPPREGTDSPLPDPETEAELGEGTDLDPVLLELDIDTPEEIIGDGGEAVPDPELPGDEPPSGEAPPGEAEVTEPEASSAELPAVTVPSAPAIEVTSPEEQRRQQRRAREVQSRALGTARRDLLEDQLRTLVESSQPTDEAESSTVKISPRTLTRLAQLSRVELASCSRELTNRRTLLTSVETDNADLSQRLVREPRDVRQGRKLVTDASFEMDELADAAVQYEASFNELDDLLREISGRVERYEKLAESATVYHANVEARSSEPWATDELRGLAEETVENLESCLETTREIETVIIDAMSRVSENVQLNTKLSVALERASLAAQGRSLTQRGAPALSRRALAVAWEDATQASARLMAGARALPQGATEAVSALRADESSGGLARRIAWTCLILIVSVGSWLWIGRRLRKVSSRPDDYGPLLAWRAEVLTRMASWLIPASGVASIALVCLRPAPGAMGLTLMLSGLLALPAYFRLIELLLSPESKYRVLLRDEGDAGPVHRTCWWLGPLALVLAPIEVLLGNTENANEETVSVVWMVHLGLALSLALYYLIRARRVVRPRLLRGPTAAALLGDIGLYAVACTGAVVILLMLGYVRLGLMILRGVALTAVPLYGVMLLDRLVRPWLHARRPKEPLTVGRSPARPGGHDADDTLGLRIVGWDLALTVQRAAFIALAGLVLAKAWGIQKPHLDFTYTLLSRGLVNVQGAEVSLLGLVKAGAVLWGVVFIARLTSRLMRVSPALARKFGTGGRYAASHLWFYFLCTCGGLWGLLAAGFDWSVLTVFAGMAGIGLGFGLQDIVRNFVSGLILLVERPMHVDDLIEAAGYTGFVTDISLRSTTVRTFDNTHVIVPNSSFIADNITNFSIRDAKVRCHIEVGVHYGSDLDQVSQVLLGVCQADEEILQHPPAQVFIAGFGDSSIDFEIVVWVPQPDPITRLTTKTRIIRAIFAEFTRVGIEIPFPQRDLNIRTGVPLPVARYEGEYEVLPPPPSPPQPADE